MREFADFLKSKAEPYRVSSPETSSAEGGELKSNETKPQEITKEPSFSVSTRIGNALQRQVRAIMPSVSATSSATNSDQHHDDTAEWTDAQVEAALEELFQGSKSSNQDSKINFDK
jgi:hypothetical protein